MSIENDRQVSRFVPDRLPEFVRVDHPTLVAFLEAYYEWLGLRRDSGIVLSPMAMHDIPDVDSSLEQFISRFKSEYLLNFPESLAISEVTNEPVDPRRLIKNIKQFYQAKGTEKSYEFLFRILYDTAVEFYYPKVDILRLSSGRWVQNNYLRISNSLGDQIYRSAGNLIVQKNASGQIVATAKVVNVNVYQIGNFDVAELLITGRNGTFQAGELGIDFEDEGQPFHEVRVFSVVSSVDITEGGTNYRVGERIRFVSNTNDGGQRGTGSVVEVDAVGGIRKISIDDFGINYSNPPTIVIDSDRGSGFVGSVSVGALCQASGYYSNNDGRLSTNKVLQDNHYYQNWSYVLKSEVVVDTYREVIRRLVHPVGTAMFGSVLIKRCSRANLDNASALMSFRIPYIGNYTPYTFHTFDDLSIWFQESITGGMTAAGYSPDYHNELIQAEGDRLAVIGNPISNNIPFVGATSGILYTNDFPTGDPFWIIYPHPNKQVDRGYHLARIWKSQVNDFRTWSEWSYNQGRKSGLDAFGENNRFTSMSLPSFDGSPAGEGFEYQYAQGGIAGSDPGEGAGGGNNNPFGSGDCFIFSGEFAPPCQVPLQLPMPNGGVCCCCVDEVNNPGLSVPRCKCEGGMWDNTGSGWQCRCPFGLIRINDECGFRCVCPPETPDCDNCGPPLCPPRPLCNSDCFDTCCDDGECPDQEFGCNRNCLDPDYANENCCECFGVGGGPPGNPTCCIDPCPDALCCLEDPCILPCRAFCLEDPFHPRCLEVFGAPIDAVSAAYCARCPCYQECPSRFCNPICPEYDPCLTSCPEFNYCGTGCTQEINGHIPGPCYPGCFDKCTATGCSGYDPCHPSCNPDPCATGTPCFDPCACADPCNQACTGFNWCECDLGGATCCSEFPCLPECNPDLCDPNLPCYDRCNPSCTGFDPCDNSCPGYGPCHPDCPEVPGNITRRPCNPLCPGFNPCLTGCPNYDRQACCQGCNCGEGGGIGDPSYRDLDDDVRRWNDERYRPEDNNPCNNDNAPCLFGQYNYDVNQHLSALLKYNENSEFRKITMGAFFKMPVGNSFDCREENIVGVALPQIEILNPLSGQEIKETENPSRPLTIRFKILNQENLGHYNIVQANVYIDNRLRSTISVNMTEFTIDGIEDGRRTLKMEMIDYNGNLVAGTQKIVIFGYQYIEPERSDDFTRLSIIGGDSQSPGLLVPDNGVPIGSQGILPNVDDGQQRRQTWELISCLKMRLERATQIALFIRQAYSCLHRLCDYPDPCNETNPQILAGFCHQDVCNSLSDVYRCMGIEWPFTCGQDDVDEHLGGLGGVLGRLLGTSGAPTSTPYGPTDAGGIIGGTLEGFLEGLNEYDACKIWSCMTTISYRFGPQKTCVDPTPFTCPDGSTKLSCLQQLNAEGKNPFCFDPNEDEEFNRNMFRARFECPGWRYEYPGYYYERYWVEDGGYWYYTGRGWYGTEQEGMPEDDSEGRDLSLDRGDRFNDPRRRPRTNDEWRQIFQSVPCGQCATDNFGNDCNQYMTPNARRLDQYLQCATRALPRGGRYLDERQRDEVISRMKNCCERFIRQDDFPNATGPVCEIMEKCARNFKSDSNSQFRLGISTCFLILQMWEWRLGSEGPFGTRQ